MSFLILGIIITIFGIYQYRQFHHHHNHYGAEAMIAVIIVGLVLIFFYGIFDQLQIR